MKDIHYAFCVAKIRALENRLLSKEDIAALISQKDLSAALSFLEKKEYATENETVNAIAKRHTIELNTVLLESVPDKNELDSLYILNDYFNLKVLVKCMLEKCSPDELFTYPTTIDYTDIDKICADADFSRLKEQYAKTTERAYGLALKSENGKFSDMIIDRAAIDTLTEYAENKNSGILGKICAFLADTANIKIALRCTATSQEGEYIKEAIGNCNALDKDKLINAAFSGNDALIAYLQSSQYSEGVETYLRNPSSFEKWRDDEVMKISSDSVYTSFGFDPAVYYFYRKSLEIKTVRMILTAIKSNVDRSIIKERVRRLYA